MAAVKVQTSRNAKAAIDYCLFGKGKGNKVEREKMVATGIGCEPGNAAELFEVDRLLHNKQGGLQAHIVYQSFLGKECNIAQANLIGRELAEKLFPGHKAVVVTHFDTANIHNHIIFNAVNADTGKKISTSGVLYRARRISNEITDRKGLSNIYNYKQETKRSRSEREILARGGSSWLEEMRLNIEDCFKKSINYTQFKKEIALKGLKIDEKRGTYINLSNPKQRARGKRLGADYTLENVKKELKEKYALFTRRPNPGEQSKQRNYVIEAMEERQRQQKVNQVNKVNKVNEVAEKAVESVADVVAEPIKAIPIIGKVAAVAVKAGAKVASKAVEVTAKAVKTGKTRERTRTREREEEEEFER